MNNKKLIWIALIILTFITFLFLVPNSIYNLSPLIFSAIGTALIIFFIFQAVYDFKNIQEYKGKVDKGNDKKFKILIISSIPLAFILFLTFFVKFGFDKSNEVNNYGLRAKGIIISANKINLRRKTGKSKVYYAKVKFVTEKGLTIISEEQISEEKYNNITIGQEIELKYSKKDPKLIKIIIEERKEPENLKISQLISLLNTEKDSINSKLLGYSNKFKRIDENNWKDNYKDVVRTEDSTMISSIIRGDLIEKFHLELKHLDFNKVNTNSNQELFESKDYKTILKKRVDGLEVFTVVIVSRK